MHLEASWRRLGGVFERSWRLLGRSRAEKSCQHGSKLAPKAQAKSIKNRSILKLISFVVPLLESILEGFWWILDAQKFSQVEFKMGSQLDVDFEGRLFKKNVFFHHQ